MMFQFSMHLKKILFCFSHVVNHYLYDLSYFSVFVYLLYLFCVILQLAYLPDRKRDFTDDDDISLDSELSLEGKLDLNNPDESVRFDRRYRKRGMLGWFKLKVLLYGH
jgi:hypothetical protein